MGGGTSSQKDTSTGSQVSNSNASTSPVPIWFPGQVEGLPSYTGAFNDIFSGNLTSPVAQFLTAQAGGAAKGATGRANQQISKTKGLSAPTKAGLVSDTTSQGIAAESAVPAQVWSSALDVLNKFYLTPPQVGQQGTSVSSSVGTSTGSGSGSGANVSLCCFIFMEVQDGVLSQDVRRFRDEHFTATSPTANGYRRMAKWLVPLMHRHSSIKAVVRWGMVIPLDRLAKWVYGNPTGRLGWLFLPLAYLWIGAWGMYGRVCDDIVPTTLHTSPGRSMTKSFIERLCHG